MPDERPKDELVEGEIGYIVTGIKKPGIASVGDTVTNAKRPAKALSGYMAPTPVIWASVYPESQDDLPVLRQSLEKLRLSDSVGAMITADEMLPFRKPHPHGLLIAADRIGVDPATSIYIGDQIFDLHAAKAAGMTSCLIRGAHTPEGAEKEADLVAASLQDLLTML